MFQRQLAIPKLPALCQISQVFFSPPSPIGSVKDFGTDHVNRNESGRFVELANGNDVPIADIPTWWMYPVDYRDLCVCSEWLIVLFIANSSSDWPKLILIWNVIFYLVLVIEIFNKIASDPQHPLVSRVNLNTSSRKSSHRNTFFFLIWTSNLFS